MTQTITATYEGGVLKPATPLPLAEGARVRITLDDAPAEPPRSNRDVRSAIAAISALPIAERREAAAAELERWANEIESMGDDEAAENAAGLRALDANRPDDRKMFPNLALPGGAG